MVSRGNDNNRQQEAGSSVETTIKCSKTATTKTIKKIRVKKLHTSLCLRQYLFLNFSVRADDNHASRDVLTSPPRMHKETEIDTRGLGLGNPSFARVIFRKGCGFPLTSKRVNSTNRFHVAVRLFSNRS